MDDDYVADVLAKEARDNSRKYVTEGLSAYAPRKPPGNAPKPNTRFLRHLIKETDTHNTALKRKEERESKDRMRQLRDQSTRTSDSASRSSQRTGRDSSHRESDRRRRDDHDDRHRSHRRRHRSRSTSTDRDRSRKQERRDEGGSRSKRDPGDRTERRRESHRHESSRNDRRDRRRSYSRSRSRSPRDSRSSRHHRSERRRTRSPSGTHSSHTRRTHHRSQRDSENDGPSRQDRLSPVESSTRRERKASPAKEYRKEESSEESDPLEELVGPLPAKDGAEGPIRSRGRGAYRPNTSTIDSHFAPDYDPTLDVQPDHDENSSQLQSRRPVAGLMAEEDDWDMALEALRDRASWRKKGEDRLRAVGINESAIDKWKNEPAFSGLDGERKPEDVRWSKKGEGREWDRGKYVDDDGHIGVRAAW